VRVTAKWLAFIGCTLLGGALPAQGSPAEPERDFGASGIFLDTIGGAFVAERPKWVHQPMLGQFIAALGRKPDDFGLTFNCAIQRSGRLRDCHTTFAAPDGVDGQALTRAFAPLLRLNPKDARLAIQKEYRITVDAALQTLDSHGSPVHCLPPQCIADDPPPAPPAPPQPQDPVIRERVKLAKECFSTEWDKSGDLRFAAEKALRENGQQPPPEAVRRAALDYVNSRTELKKCMAMLETTEHLPTITPGDKKAVDEVLGWMELNYSGQTKFEIAILAGVLDKKTGEAELSFPGEWP
jgi:hypothetical protein